MRDLLLLADEPARTAPDYADLGVALGWVRHRRVERAEPPGEFVVDDPSGTLEPLDAVRALCLERGLRPLFVTGTTDESVVYATLWAEALGARCACPTEAIDFFYDRLEQRRLLGEHPWNVRAVAGDEAHLLTGSGPWVVKPRGGAGAPRRCETPDEVAAAVGDNPADHLVEPWLPGVDLLLDAFYVHGAIRLTALAESTVEVRSPALLAGPVLPEELVADLLADLSDVLTARGFEEGPVHARFRAHRGAVKLVSLRPRPGGDDLPALGALTGAASVPECFGRMLRGDDLPPYAFPSTWAYQVRVPEGPSFDAVRAAVPEAEIRPAGSGWSLRLLSGSEPDVRRDRATIEELLRG